MRDPARIEPLLAELAVYWKAHADLRLGQLLWAVCGRDPFAVEDDEWLGLLRGEIAPRGPRRLP